MQDFQKYCRSVNKAFGMSVGDLPSKDNLLQEQFIDWWMMEMREAYLAEVESRTQGSRPKKQKKSEAKSRPRTDLPRTDPLEAKDRNARGQGPRTQAQVLYKKKVFKNFFLVISKKKVFT